MLIYQSQPWFSDWMHYWPKLWSLEKFIIVKDTLKAFYDFKNKQKRYKVMFLICKTMHVLKVHSIHYTLR